MINSEIELSSEDIYNKEFKIDTRGYRPQEVDKFLDIIIKDYTEYINMTKRLRKENRLLEDEISRLKQEIRKLRDLNESNEVESNTTRITNLDILKRLSSLEKTVYGKDI